MCVRIVDGDGKPPEESDPVVMAINAQIAELAADSVCWLMCRLGPLLTTQHIVKPLLDGLHRSTHTLYIMHAVLAL